MTDIELAKEIAHRAHYKLTRRSGEPYIEHVRRVVGTLLSQGANSEMIAAAWLHDTVEDTSITLSNIYELFPGTNIPSLVSYLTHSAFDSYEEYIRDIKEDPEATKIKLADLTDNLRDNDNPSQIERYTKAILTLTT